MQCGLSHEDLLYFQPTADGRNGQMVFTLLRPPHFKSSWDPASITVHAMQWTDRLSPGRPLSV